jgi:HD-GYP domain-containing protein (c-di-GMP phosphodiesterase class II)
MFSEMLNMESQNALYLALYRYTRSLSVALDYRDSLTALHSERVHDLSEALGLHYGLSDEELAVLKIGASFHDVGKIGIPDLILLKPSPLDSAEWETMKWHSAIGEKIMVSTGLTGAKAASMAIRHHHEHYNGQGYPDGLSGEQIPICARIISIADSYDAMAVTRSYHRAKKHREIMDILHEESGQKHDPDLMLAFSEIIESSRGQELKPV